MVTVFVHRDGRTEQVPSVDRAWLTPEGQALLWVDLAAPSPIEVVVLRDTFGFHPLAVEDALSKVEYPKIESYDDYLYLILHGIDFRAAEHGFGTHDVDFFLGPNYLVTVHDGTSRSVGELRDHCPRNHKILGEGPAALMHRIVDAMVDHYMPEVEKLEDRLDELEKAVLASPRPDLIADILEQKRDVSSLRRVITPQRDAVGRLARREFALIDTEMAYRFRDVGDHLVRLADEATMFQDRITGILDAHLSNVSNRLNEVMKVLTVIATIFMPLTVLTGLYGMNVTMPHFPGGEGVQFWWLVGIMLGMSGAMLAWFHRKGWI
ncbi:MAG: magnesium/cobalt transporter CorA [Acidobacteriota bacterium]|nr:magnesium/cobalt transporter CorA [Acidobacteriota bacterium]